jgi:peptide/nickel transport system substrate-binding protein
MITRRKALASAAALGLCRPAIAQPSGARTLRFVPQAGYVTPDPIWTTAIVVQTHAFMVWDMPYGVDLALNPHPQMCAGHEVSDDGLTWTFTLREGLLFHDGEPVRGVDMIASIRRWGRTDSFGQRLLALAADMSAPDDRRFRIRLTQPFPQMLYALGIGGGQSCFIMPERLANTPSSQPVSEYIGSGPFRFVHNEWLSGVHSVYARFDKYVPRQEPPDFLSGGKVVHFDRVEWTVQPDPGTAIAALQTGEVDWIDQPLFDLVPTLKQTAGVSVQQLDPFGLIGIMALNHLHPPFDNPKLLAALLPAVDQHDYLAAVLGDQTDYGKYPVGYFAVGSPMANDAGMAALTGPRDIALARKLVANSGYGGEPVLVMEATDQPQMYAMAQVMSSMFKQIGLNVQEVAMDWGTLLSRRPNTKPPSEGGWNCFNTRLTGLGAANPASAELRGNGLKAWYGWPTDPALDSLADAWFRAPDLASQKQVAEQMQLEAFRSVPYIPLGQWSQPTAFRTDLSGFVRSSNPLFWGVQRG